MSEIKYTPGPWIADYDTVRTNGRVIIEVHNAAWPEHIKNTHKASAYLGQERQANARLIAAAPDMFEALSRWVDLAETAIRELGIEPHPDERKCLDLARNALTKARATPVSDTAPTGQGGGA